MAIKDFLDGIFGTRALNNLSASELACLNDVANIWRYQYAQQIVAELYGSLLSKCEFKTFVKDKFVKADNYYKFNYEPNPNQSSSEFMKQLANKLITNCEALIVQTSDGNFYVADSYTKGNRQLVETYFTNVVVDLYNSPDVMPYQLEGTFSGENAIFVRYANSEALRLISKMNEMYSQLAENVKNSGSNKIKYALKIDTNAVSGVDIDYDAQIKKLVNDDFKKLVSDNNAIIPLVNGFDLTVLNQANNNSQNASISSKNVNELLEQTLTMVGHIYNVPKSFMLGTYEENDLDHFLTFGLDPFADLIGEAINRKFYNKKNVLEGTYLTVDTKKVKHFDIMTVSDAINKMISSGAFSINEVRLMLDEKPIDAEIGDTHWITRNYAVVGDYLTEQMNAANDGSVTGGGLK